MIFHSLGLIFLLVAVGFFLGWGNPTNVTSDLILGGIFAILGYSGVTYRNPLTPVVDQFNQMVKQVQDDRVAPTSYESAGESVQRIRVEARKTARALKEEAQNRIDRIIHDTQNTMAEGAKS
ncbi:MAG: hypothetical protein AABY11_04040 [archaeon]